MYEDGNYGFSRMVLIRAHTDMAMQYAKLSDRANTVAHLAFAAEHAIKFDTEYDPDGEYTCFLFRGMKFGGVWYGDTENESLSQLNKMKREIFDFVRSDTEFNEIEEKLKKYAKNR